MPFDLRWIASSAASSLHTANLLCAGRPIVAKKLAAELAAPAEALGAQIAAAGLDTATWFAHAIPLSVQYPTPERWAEVVSAKIAHGQHVDHALAARLARHLAELERAIERAHPGTVDELELRAKPLAEQWEARGAGLLLQMGRLTDPELIVSA